MRDMIEPGGIDARPDHDGQIRLSMAISAKRQADALERIADAIAPTEGVSVIDTLNEVLTDFTNNLSSTLRDARN